MIEIGNIAFWVSVGLVVGWNFLPQPKWVADAVNWTVAKAKEIFDKFNKV